MFTKKINKFQVKLLEISKKYLTSENKKNIDTSISPLCFFTIWAETPGYYKIINLSKLNLKINFFFILKNLISNSKNFSLKIINKIDNSVELIDSCDITASSIE